MRKLGLILTTLVLVWCPFARASQEGHFSSIDAFLKSTLKGEAQLSFEARGDLNGDGLEDWTGVIYRQKSTFSSTSQLYVLLRLRQGGYRVAEKSKEEVITVSGCCWVEDLELSRASLYIQVNAKTAVSMEAITYQFKLYKGEWRLIGVRVFYLEPSLDASVGTDMNLLTGMVIEERRKGKNRPMTQRHHKQFSTHLLKDFDFSFSEFGTE